VFVLLEQRQLMHDNRPQSQQLRAPQAFDWHLRAPLKDGLEQAIEPFNGLGTKLMENPAHLKGRNCSVTASFCSRSASNA
jgi:hypothetical protein